MKKERLNDIDLVKAIGIIGVIAIHVLTYYLSNPLSRFIWNYAQFVVVAFVFSSGYILPIAYSAGFKSLKDIIFWYKKRFIRLLLPFYVFLVAHYLLWNLFPNFFQGLGLKNSLDYFISSALLFGGTNFNFLPLLFVQLSLIFPLLLKISKSKSLTVIYLTLAGFITLYFTFLGFPYAYYREVMWIPWSIVLFLATWLVVHKSNIQSVERGKYFIMSLVFSLWFVILFLYQSFSEHSLNFYNHKYPPDFFYISYGLALTLILILIARREIFLKPHLQKTYSYVSKNSYSIFFIHYIVLDNALTLRSRVSILENSLAVFLYVVVVTSVVLYVINLIKKKFIGTLHIPSIL